MTTVAGRTAFITGGANGIGRMALEAVLADHLCIHTDRAVYAPIRARTEALLAAMPPA